jgi:hypothetical protein
MAPRRLQRRLRAKKTRRGGAAQNKEVGAMKVLKSSVFWGVLMVVAGGLLLLEALGALAVGA